MADERDEVRARIDIVELVGREVQLTQKGKVWKGLCPFHADKNPSFEVSRQAGRYNCWSCGEKGDIFNWVMKRQNVEFREALTILAKEAGVTLTTRGESQPPSVRIAQEAAMDAALDFFKEHLAKNTGAREYCERRGLDEATLKTWEIGYAPDVGDALATYLKRKGMALAQCRDLFLVDQDASGGYYDRFRGRLMFPIRDEKGALVAFGGRLLGDGHPKYINSSDTPLYRKSKVLYGMNRARTALGKEKRAVLVEGYLDVIACHRAGVETALASLGTSLSEDHGKLLKRWVEEVVVLYDSDAAGQKAADRAVGILTAEGLKVRVALMPPGEDPDTLLKNAGPAAVQQSVETGLSPMDYRMQALVAKVPFSDPSFWEQAAAFLAEAPTEPELVRHLDRLAGVYPDLGNSPALRQALRDEVNKRRRPAAKAPSRPKSAPAVKVRHVEALSSDELAVFAAFLSESFRSNGWRFTTLRELFASPLAVSISEAVSAVFTDGPPKGAPALWLHRIEDEELRQSLADLLQDPRNENLTEEYIHDAVMRLRKRQDNRKLADMKKGEMDSAARQQYLLELRKRNPDTVKRQRNDDKLF